MLVQRIVKRRVVLSCAATLCAVGEPKKKADGISEPCGIRLKNTKTAKFSMLNDKFAPAYRYAQEIFCLPTEKK